MVLSRRSALSAMAVMGLPAVAASRVPVLLELFTSEGCSSCPPADLLLEVLDRQQPVSGADIVVVSEHVDYWNHIGWTDPFSSATYSRRQQHYAQRFGLDGVYTPQMIVDGRWQFVGSDERLATKAIINAAASAKIGLIVQQEGARLVIRSTAPFEAAVDVSVIRAREHAVSNVARGENRGRELRHVSVATALLQAGQVQKHRIADLRVDADPRGSERVIVFAQELRTGHIAAVARV